MTKEVLYETLKETFREILDKYGIGDKTARVGEERRRDGELPVTPGAEVKLIAEYEGATGECSTSFPEQFDGPLSEVSGFDIANDPQKRSVFIAVLNAVMNRWELSDDCVSCTESDRERCGESIAARYKRNNGRIKLLLAGYQPYILKALAADFPLRVLDLDPEHIGKTYGNITVENGAEAFSDAAWWADAILCTGSALANGTIVDYMNMPKDVAYYGTTIAGCARFLELRRQCPYARN
ncbi:MAG: hypothetical protein LBL26_10250 [Peptococcaceae bacterium]|nr:hypothetical protein [Peptococcaceae bacterium]